MKEKPQSADEKLPFQTIDLKVAARSVAISPDFSRRGSGQMFVTGERDLLLHERRFFSNHKYTVSEVFNEITHPCFLHVRNINFGRRER